MRTKISILFSFGLVLALCSIVFSADIGTWTGADNGMKEDVNTVSKLGQWTETFANGNWGVGSWVKGNATDAAGKLIWKLQGPVITKSHPSIFFDTDGDDGLPDTIQTNYRGGTFTLYDAPALWGSGAVFTCEDTIIEDHFDPIKKTYEYGFVTGVAVNKKLGLTVYLDARVIETSTAGSAHSGELTNITLAIVPDAIRKAIEKHFPNAHIREITKKTDSPSYYKIVFVYQGKRMDAQVSSEGVLGKVSSIVELKDVPAAVARTIKEKLQDKKIVRINCCETYGTVKSGKLVALKSPTVLFDVKYSANGQTRNLPIEHAGPVRPKYNRTQIWMHNGKTPKPYIANAIKKAADLLK